MMFCFFVENTKEMKRSLREKRMAKNGKDGNLYDFEKLENACPAFSGRQNNQILWVKHF